MSGKKPSKEVVITFAITETPEGKLSINAQIPEHAADTVALILANAAMEVMREMMRRTGHESEIQEQRLQ